MVMTKTNIKNVKKTPKTNKLKFTVLLCSIEIKKMCELEVTGCCSSVVWALVAEVSDPRFDSLTPTKVFVVVFFSSHIISLFSSSELRTICQVMQQSIDVCQFHIHKTLMLTCIRTLNAIFLMYSNLYCSYVLWYASQFVVHTQQKVYNCSISVSYIIKALAFLT